MALMPMACMSRTVDTISRDVITVRLQQEIWRLLEVNLVRKGAFELAKYFRMFEPRVALRLSELVTNVYLLMFKIWH